MLLQRHHHTGQSSQCPPHPPGLFSARATATCAATCPLPIYLGILSKKPRFPRTEDDPCCPRRVPMARDPVLDPYGKPNSGVAGPPPNPAGKPGYSNWSSTVWLERLRLDRLRPTIISVPRSVLRCAFHQGGDGCTALNPGPGCPGGALESRQGPACPEQGEAGPIGYRARVAYRARETKVKGCRSVWEGQGVVLGGKN